MKKQDVSNKKKLKDSKKPGAVDGGKIKKSIKKEKPVVKNEKPAEQVNKLTEKQKKVHSTELIKTKPVKVENVKIKKEPTKHQKDFEKKLTIKPAKRKNQAVLEAVPKKLKNSEEKATAVSKKLKNSEEKATAVSKKLKNSEEKATVVSKKLKKSTSEEKVPAPKHKKLKSHAEQSIEVDKKLKVKTQKVEKPVEEEKKIKKVKKDKKSKKVTKGIKIEVEGEEKIVNDLEIDEQHILKAVDGILQLAEQEKSDKSLFSSDDNPILLQVNCIKIPRVPHRRMRILLPHDMVGPTDDVVLFVADLEKKRRKDYEKTIEHWQNVLQEKGVSRIKEIIPMAKVKAEYRQFEMMRKLSRLFDFYLVDGKIAGHMAHLLGSTFTRGANPPTPVKLWRDNLKEEIDFALKKTCMEIHGHGGVHCVKIATVAMPKKKIAENILAACKALEKDYPGGFDNIRSLSIKTRKSLAVPIYYTMKNKDEVEVPKVKPKRPKAYKTVVGELSTLSDDDEDIQVAVHPRGSVKILKKKSDENADKQIKPKKEKLKQIKNKPSLKAKTKANQKKVLEKKI